MTGRMFLAIFAYPALSKLGAKVHRFQAPSWWYQITIGMPCFRAHALRVTPQIQVLALAASQRNSSMAVSWLGTGSSGPTDLSGKRKGRYSEILALRWLTAWYRNVAPRRSAWSAVRIWPSLKAIAPAKLRYPQSPTPPKSCTCHPWSM